MNNDKLLLAKPESEYPETASEFANELNNDRSDDSFGRLASDQEYWEKYGVSTGAELADSLNRDNFSDIYKEENGIRPKGEHWTNERMKEVLQFVEVELY